MNINEEVIVKVHDIQDGRVHHYSAVLVDKTDKHIVIRGGTDTLDVFPNVDGQWMKVSLYRHAEVFGMEDVQFWKFKLRDAGFALHDEVLRLSGEGSDNRERVQQALKDVNRALFLIQKL